MIRSNGQTSYSNSPSQSPRVSFKRIPHAAPGKMYVTVSGRRRGRTLRVEPLLRSRTIGEEPTTSQNARSLACATLDAWRQGERPLDRGASEAAGGPRPG